MRFSILAVLSFALAGCSDDESGSPTFDAYFSNGSVNFAYDSDGKWLKVVASGQWSLSIVPAGENPQPWCYVNYVGGPSMDEGEGTQDVWIASDLNYTGVSRQATITVTSGTAQLILDITQLDQNGELPLDMSTRLELPRIDDMEWFIYHSTGNYSFEYLTDQKHSKWVAWPLYKSCFGNSGRSDDYRIDPAIAPGSQPNSTFGSGYDRGHLCPSADRTATKEMNSETYYYTNMSPQVSRFNQGIWLGLETKERAWLTNQQDTIYICCGGTVMSDTAIKGYARGNVAIPKYYFKVFLRKKSTGVYDATGFWFENRSYDDTYDGTNAQKNAALKACIKTVDDIEELTGFDFFYNLSTDIQNRVEAEYNPKAWGFSAN